MVKKITPKKINVAHSTINILTPFLFIALALISIPFAGYIGVGIFRFSCTIFPLFSATEVCFSPEPYSLFYMVFEIALFIFPIWLLFLYLWYGLIKRFNKFLKEHFNDVIVCSNQKIFRAQIVIILLLFIPLSMQIAYLLDEKVKLLGVTPFLFPITPIDFIAFVPIWLILAIIFLMILKITMGGKVKNCSCKSCKI